MPLGGTGDPEAELYERFLGEVCSRQLAEWLPVEPSLILDLSRGRPELLRLMVDAGHTVIHAEQRPQRPDIRRQATTGGRLIPLRADPFVVDWVADGCVDAIVAEGGTMSGALAAELTLERLFAALCPGGRLLLCVESLVAGLANLAEAGRWAELADVPAADVVLSPRPSGQVTRCFWPEELHGMLTAAGFEVEWIRPRTVLTEQTVVRTLQQDAGQLESLVNTELALEGRRQSESIGAELLASAVRP